MAVDDAFGNEVSVHYHQQEQCIQLDVSNCADYTVRLYDASGKQLSIITTNNPTTRLCTRELSAGEYNILVCSMNAFMQCKVRVD